MRYLYSQNICTYGKITLSNYAIYLYLQFINSKWLRDLGTNMSICSKKEIFLFCSAKIEIAWKW